MSATHTDQRIRKLLAQGLAPESIARKIGRPGPDGLARVAATVREIAASRRDPHALDACLRVAGPMKDRRAPRKGAQVALKRQDPEDCG